MKKFSKTILILSILIPFLQYNSAFAQFGKNKVQYQTYDWMYIQSEHFDIYYNAGSKYLAEFAAFNAEMALASIQNDFNFLINRRIPIILYNSHVQFQQTNAVSSYMPEGVGGVTELFKNRVVLPFDGNYESFRHVIAHELTHAILNDMFYGGTFQTAVSSGNNFMIPLWMNEGLAEWESQKTLTPLTDMFIRDLVINNLLPDLKDLDGYLAYRGGQTFYWYISDNFGKDKISELLNKLNSLRNVDNAFKSTFNMSLEEFSEKWKKDLKKMYLPDVKIFDDPDDFAEKMTDHKKEYKFWNSSPSISPNGQKFAYISDDNGVFAIFIKGLDKKSEPEKLVSSFREQDFEELNVLTPGISWNPKGDKLAISAKSGGENAVFIIDVKSGDYEKLKWGLRSITSVTWSPDGKKLAFMATLPYQSDIFIYDFDSQKLENITNDIFSDAIPVWSSDSKTIYFTSDRGDNLSTGESGKVFKIWKTDFDSQDIYSYDFKTKSIKRLTFDSKAHISSIAASNITDKLFFTSDKNGIYNIYELDLNTLKTKPKTNSIIGITQITVSPDASKLLFSGQINGGYDIYYMRFPLEKQTKSLEIPLTVYKESVVEKRNLVSELTDTTKTQLKDTTQEANKNYGKFKVDFSRQNFVESNPDVVQKPISENSVKGETLSNEEEYIEKPYKVTFTPDAILGNPNFSNVYGFQTLTQMLFSDVMGDHQIYAQINLLSDLRNSSFLVNYSYLPNLIDFGGTIYHSSIYLPLSDGYYYRFRNYGFQFDASLPFDLFRRLDFGLNITNLSRENLDFPLEPSVEHTLIVPSLRYVFDNTLPGWFGPELGMRYYFGLTASPKIFSNSASFYNVETDIRFYQPIISNYLFFAIRGSAGGSFGANPIKFFMGGTENWINAQYYGNYIPFNDPVDFGFLEFKMPMRGWSIGEQSGSKFFMFNTELRFPLFTALLAGPVPILLQGVMGSFFFDIGSAFNDNFTATQKDVWGNTIPKDLLMSTGIGVRTYLLGLPVKMDIAWRNEYYAWSKPQYMFSLGYDF